MFPHKRSKNIGGRRSPRKSPKASKSCCLAVHDGCCVPKMPGKKLCRYHSNQGPKIYEVTDQIFKITFKKELRSNNPRSLATQNGPVRPTFFSLENSNSRCVLFSKKDAAYIRQSPDQNDFFAEALPQRATVQFSTDTHRFKISIVTDGPSDSAPECDRRMDVGDAGTTGTRTTTWANIVSSPPVPTQPAPIQPAPIQPAPIKPAPIKPAPIQPAPIQPAPTQPAPTQPVPTQHIQTPHTSASCTHIVIPNFGVYALTPLPNSKPLDQGTFQLSINQLRTFRFDPDNSARKSPPPSTQCTPYDFGGLENSDPSCPDLEPFHTPKELRMFDEDNYLNSLMESTFIPSRDVPPLVPSLCRQDSLTFDPLSDISCNSAYNSPACY